MLLMIIPGKCDGEKQSWIGRWCNASNSRYSPSLPGRDWAFPESSGQAERKCPGNPQYRQHHSFMRWSRSDGEIRVPPNCIGSGDPWDSGNSSLGTGLKGGVNTNWWLNLLSLRRLSSRTARSIRASRSLEGSRVASSSLSASERPFWKHTTRDSLFQPLPAAMVWKWMEYSAALRLPCWRDSSHLGASRSLMGWSKTRLNSSSNAA